MNATELKRPASDTGGRFASAEPVLAWLVVGATVVGFVALCVHLQWSVVDDAAISAAYGISFWKGLGFRATAASQVVEAFSSPLWTLMLGAAVPLRCPPIAFSQWLGVALGALSLPVFALWGPRAEGRSLRLEDTVAPLLACVAPSLAGWASSGMETGLWCLAIALAGMLVLNGLRTGAGKAAGAAVGLLAWVRPEAPLFMAALGAAWLVGPRFGRRRLGRPEVEFVLAAGLVAGSWQVFRWGYFGAFVPNTYTAKLVHDFGGGAYLSGFLTSHSALLVAAVSSLVLTVLTLGKGLLRGALAMLLAACAVVFAWKIAKGDWMGEWRFLVPAIPLFGAAVAAGLGSARTLIAASHSTWRVRTMAALGASVVVLAGLGLVQQLRRVEAVHKAPQFPFTMVEDYFKQLKVRMAALGQRRALIGFPDLGGQSLTMVDAEIIDVAGLGDIALAQHYADANYAAMDDYLVTEGPPVMVDAHGPSGHMRGLPRLMATMVDSGGHELSLRGLSPVEDPRCAGGKQRVLGLSATALQTELSAAVEAGDALGALKLWRCAFAYLPDEQLPPRAARWAMADRAVERSTEFERQAKLEEALREMSFAAVISQGDPHLRRRAEALRRRVFLPPPRPTGGAAK